MSTTQQLRSGAALRRALISGMMSLPLMTVPGLAQESTNRTEVMKPVIVTGSYIPTAETVGPAPVETVTAADIEKVGAQDVLQLLQRVSPVFSGASNLGITANNLAVSGGQAAGESGVAIRNLSTLVLLDGRRLVNSALSAGQAVDLNTIPLAMIERIEVLKDGASALYGSDAIGGVVNIITKKNWSGAEISGRVGFPTRHSSNDILERRASVVAGTTTDKTSFVAGASYYTMDPLLAKDRFVATAGINDLAARDIQQPAYFSGSYPGRVGSSLLAGSPLAINAPGYNPALNTPPVDIGVRYNTLADYQAAHPGVYIPIDSLPEAQAAGAPTILNTTKFGTISVLKTDRRNAWANFEHDLFEKKVQLFGEFLYANLLNQAQLAPAVIPSIANNGIIVPANNPYNPFQREISAVAGSETPPPPVVRYRLLDFGNRIFNAQTDFYRLVGGLRGEISPDYSYEAAYSYNRADQEYVTENIGNGAAVNLALQPDFNADPTGRLSKLTDANGNALPTFNIFAIPRTGANDPATLNQIRATTFDTGVSELWSVDGRVNGSPFELPAGKLSFAVGGSYVEESISLFEDGLKTQNLALGVNATLPFPGGHRNRGAGFVEVLIPITSPQWNFPGAHALELNAAGRIEEIDPGGESLVPKFNIRWQPIDEQFTVRGGYSEGFIAPSIFSLFGPASTQNPTVTIGGESRQETIITESNSKLPPSDSKMWSVGGVISPKIIPGLTLTADYYSIEQNKVVTADFVSPISSLNTLGSASPFAPGFLFSTGARLTTPDPNQITVENFGTLSVQNTAVAAQRTDGIDFGMNYTIPIAEDLGRLNVFANANWTMNYEYQNLPGKPFYHYEGMYTSQNVFSSAQGLIPDWRLVTGFTWDIMGFTYSVLANYIPPVTDVGGLHAYPQSLPGADPSHGNTVSGGVFKVPDYYKLDMQIAYSFGKRGGTRWYDGTRLAFGVNNITDEDAPFIASGAEDNTDKSQYDIWGRFVYFEVSKRF